ncbi:MAG: alpha/beta hydrolase [Alphaproteobacteria bacterium]
MTERPQLQGPALPPAAGGPPQQIVILCHGYGADGQDLVGLALGWRELLPHAAFFSPNAPEQVPGAPMGRQWWAIRQFSPEESATGLQKAAPILDAFIDECLENAGLTEKDLALVGFSQGTMMALQVGLSRATQLAGILGYSGAVAAPDLLRGAIRSKPPIQLIHGDLDNMIPVSAMAAAARFLEGEGLSVSTHISENIGHGIAPDGVDLGGKFLLDCFSG